MGQWLSENWFNLLSAVGIIGSLWFTAVSLRSDAKTRRVANLLTITANYREIWKQYFSNPELARVLDPSADVAAQPVTPAEELFVVQIIIHVSNVFYAMKDDLFIAQDGSRRDIAQFFSLPVPEAVWRKSKPLQNQDFAAFIDDSLKEPEPSVTTPRSAWRIRGLPARRTRSVKPRPFSNASTVASTSKTG